MKYTPRYTKRWIKNLKKYISLKKDVLSKIDKIIEDPALHLTFDFPPVIRITLCQSIHLL